MSKIPNPLRCQGKQITENSMLVIEYFRCCPEVEILGTPSAHRVERGESHGL